LVLCSQHKPDREGGSIWIEYRSYTESKATIWGRGQSWKLAVVELADLLSVVDRAEDSARANLSPKAVVEPEWA
jgi:rhamnogalacturonyl hydrolase YesR